MACRCWANTVVQPSTCTLQDGQENHRRHETPPGRCPSRGRPRGDGSNWTNRDSPCGCRGTGSLSKLPLSCYKKDGGVLHYLQVPGAYPPASLYLGVLTLAGKLSLFVDESGDRTGRARYYLVTLVAHDQSDGITKCIGNYEQSLLLSDLPNIPFHSEPLLNGHGPYANLSMQQRKKILIAFNVLVQRLPIRYHTLAYKRKEFLQPDELAERMERDITHFLREHLAFFQSFEKVVVYYDNGQDIVKRALDRSMASALSTRAVARRRTSMTDYRLEQAADYLCTLELAAIKYAAKEDGETYNKFYGGIGSFKRNWLKQIRRKRLD